MASNETLLQYLLVLLFLGFTAGCNNDKPITNQQSRVERVENVAKAYFSTFAERNDWEKFCSFYKEDMEFEDIILQLKLDSLWQFKRFYNWQGDGDNFQKLSPEQDHLILESLVANDSVAVGKVSFQPFYYYGKKIEPEWGMAGTIWLYFDRNLKIRKQIDWIEYDKEVLESVVKRCRENGHEALPEWLDLSREK